MPECVHSAADTTGHLIRSVTAADMTHLGTHFVDKGGPKSPTPPPTTRRFESNRTNLRDRETVTVVVVRPAHHIRTGTIGAIVMRSTLSFPALAFSALVLGVLSSITSASAAREHHYRPRHAIVRHAYGYIDPPRYV